MAPLKRRLNHKFRQMYRIEKLIEQIAFKPHPHHRMIQNKHLKDD